MNTSPKYGSMSPWDFADEGHLLSYFLSADNNEATAANRTLNGNEIGPKGSNGAVPTFRQNNFPFLGQHFTSIRFASDTVRSTTEQRIGIPSTPAIQFYPSLKQKFSDSDAHRKSSVSMEGPKCIVNQPQQISIPTFESSSSIRVVGTVGLTSLPSFSSMASSLLKESWQLPTSSPIPSDISPLSPAAQVGTGQETMMLPPPQRFSGSNSYTILSTNTDGTDLKSVPSYNSLDHIQWIHQLNNAVTLTDSNQYRTSLISRPTAVQTPPFNPLTTMSHPVSVHNMHPDMNRNQPQSTDSVQTIPISNHLAITNQDTTHCKNNNRKVESEEKRAKRLERNRESARQSRRRKKERLIELGLKVSKLHAEIENEVRKRMSCMESELKFDQVQKIQHILNSKCEAGSSTLGVEHYDGSPSRDRQENLSSRLAEIICDGGPNSSARRVVAAYQYQGLRNLILPAYQRFLLWLLLNYESFHLCVREKRLKFHQINKGIGRTTLKQEGEVPADDPSNKLNVTCGAYDSNHFWPYFCDELALGMDQEDKLAQCSKSLQSDEAISSVRSQLNLAIDVIACIKSQVLYQSHTASYRIETTLLHILTPNQSFKFLQWAETNRERYCNLLGVMKRNELTEPRQDVKTTMGKDDLTRGSNNNAGSSFTSDLQLINALCEQLKGSLMIPPQISAVEPLSSAKK